MMPRNSTSERLFRLGMTLVPGKPRTSWRPPWGSAVFVMAAALVLVVLVPQASAGARRTYVAKRPGVLVKLTTTPQRVVGLRLQATLRCSNGSRRPLSLSFQGVSDTSIANDGAFLFHHGHGYAVTIARGTVGADSIRGRFRYTSRSTPGNLRCGTRDPNGLYVNFAARAPRR